MIAFNFITKMIILIWVIKCKN